MEDLFRSLQAALADRYQLERELGRGGMATVYLARERKHPRHVALKVLRPQLAGVMTRGRFLREIRISSELTHPHILPLLDSGVIAAADGRPDLPYYTMPYIKGESLLDRLAREHQLPLADALEIARNVADALEYAHGHGVIHRDIKPGNILLSGGHAIVADFGIARAVKESVDPDAVTSAGMVIGTPAYMSPEQAAGVAELDGRSDLYSLGCLVYEMLGGEPPFTGATAQAVLARHRMDHAPSLRTLRVTVPEAVEAAVMRALEKSPADRFATAREFADALHAGAAGSRSASTPRTPQRRRWRLGLSALALTVLAGAAWQLTGGWRGQPVGGTALAEADTTRYAILSFGQDTGVPASLHPALLLRDALGRWDGVHPVDPFQIRDLVAGQDTSGFAERDWRRLASSLGAGRYIRATATLVGDSIRIHAVLYDGTGDRANPVLREQTMRLPRDLAGVDSSFARLAAGLLLPGGAAGRVQPVGHTTSLPARQAFEAGTSAIDAWDLAAADSNFAEAVRFDPQYAEALLWLALVRSWREPEMPAAWLSPAERAAALRSELSSRDQAIAGAVLGQAHGGDTVTCRAWRQLTEANPHDFVVWYGFAGCLSNDRVVLRDRQSPTGWRFRSSYHEALNAYARASTLLPSILQEIFGDNQFTEATHRLLATGTDLRSGHGLSPDGTRFVAAPSWEGDTLILYPVSLALPDWNAQLMRRSAPEAVRHQRERMRQLASGWVANQPGSADALQALAVSLLLLGDRTALDTLVRARGMARSPAERIRVGTVEIWTRVLFGAPSGTSDLRDARRLADSILVSVPVDPLPEPRLLASLATLTGHAYRAATLGRQTPIRNGLDTPPPLAGLGIRFLTYAALGGPTDSLQRLARDVAEALRVQVAPEAQGSARLMWLELPVMLAFPTVQLPSVPTLVAPGAPLIRADAAFMRGDSVTAWRALRASEVDGQAATIDVRYPEAWLIAALGHPDAAAARLDVVLDALDTTPPQLFLEVYQAGALIRAMALRAELADRLGDRATARQWAGAVVKLWSGADEFLQPLVNRMRSLAR